MALRKGEEGMSVEEKIMQDYKQAMKEKNPLKVSVLSFLRSQLKYAMIDKKLDKLPDSEVIAVIKKQVKQRLDSMEQFEKGGRQDLVKKENSELEILKGYLPEGMPLEALKAAIEAVIQESGAKTIKDMGTVMKLLLPKIAGRADSKVVSDMVKEKLSQHA